MAKTQIEAKLACVVRHSAKCLVVRSAYDPRLPQLAACLSARAASSSTAEQDRISSVCGELADSQVFWLTA